MHGEARSVDIAIIGGGCVGLSIAAHLGLARSRARIVLLEKGQLGGGTTGKSGGVVRGNYSHPTLARMARSALDVFHSFRRRYGVDAGFQQSGYLAIFEARDAETVALNISMQHEVGLRTCLLSHTQVAEMIPDAYLEDVDGAIFEDEAGYVEPRVLVDALAWMAKDGGVQILQGVEVLKIKPSGAGFGAVTPVGTWNARRVVLATNAWTNRLLAPLGVCLPLESTRHQLARLIYPAHVRRMRQVFVDMVHQFYIRPTLQGQALIGSSREEDAHDYADPDSYKDTNDDAYLASCAAFLKKRFVDWGDVSLVNGHSGIYDITPDWQPILGPLQEYDGLLVACGFSGHGLKLSPVVGKGIADVLVSGSTEEFDIDLFTPARFDRRQLITPARRYMSGFPYR